MTTRAMVSGKIDKSARTVVVSSPEGYTARAEFTREPQVAMGHAFLTVWKDSLTETGAAAYTNKGILR